MNFSAKLILLIFLFASMQVFAEIDLNQSFFSKNQKFDKDGVEFYNSNIELKRHKKFGLGVSIGGANGAVGLNSELNLDPENALVIGMGIGPSYGSFNLLYKRNLENMYLSPYGKLGYSKWFNSSSNTVSAKDSDILRRIFSENDLKTGQFDADFLVSSVGAEYNQLEGELSGVNFYGELVLMTEVKKSKVIPSGAVGIVYFY